MSYETKVYKDAGGDRETFAPGAVLKLGSVVFTVATDGNVIVTGLPTSEPAAVGALWLSGTTLMVSNGP